MDEKSSIRQWPLCSIIARKTNRVVHFELLYWILQPIIHVKKNAIQGTNAVPCRSELARDGLKDYACFLAKRGALESLASKLAPDGLKDYACFLAKRGALESLASKLAPDGLKDYACFLAKRGALESLASKLAPT
ncbi:hypothetical protein PS662_02133 [Pseudomonas fluorescens]|uniref:Uncharacterized protein n=1 Tax=Pseudomonas fluorescens TaxID=294 RepID=A0A5E6S9E1_PSEFL|nr:hypothetical protein PS662_02133 [Pseudomonas fluorescens]